MSGPASDAAGAVRAAVEKQPDVVLMDLGLSDSGLDGVEAGKSDPPEYQCKADYTDIL